MKYNKDTTCTFQRSKGKKFGRADEGLREQSSAETFSVEKDSKEIRTCMAKVRVFIPNQWI